MILSPSIYIVHVNSVSKDLRAFNVGSHVIFMKITDYGIAVIRVLHQSMDFNRHL
ncbi:type II toxin-antitoxin system RelE/ParE family toxin [Legionella norrlandica]|uniref:type II toxin-antitoxin system RelE/ParE family toxin n=1 Tax=Legionella norrlandica TaxID=1498499 RepID=UPI0015630F21